MTPVPGNGNSNLTGVSRAFTRESGLARTSVSVRVSGTPFTPSYSEEYSVVATLLGAEIEFCGQFTRMLDELELAHWMASEIQKRLWMTLPHCDGETIQ